MPENVLKVAALARAHLTGEGTGHDWEHICRVWQIAKKLAEQEKADTELVELAALVHDLDDYKVSGNEQDEEALPRARQTLAEAGVNAEKIEQVCDILSTLGFRKTLDGKIANTLEGSIVSDADFLEAIGAIGIARCLTFGGSKGRPIFIPDIYPAEDLTQATYKNRPSPAINHFFEKLLTLRNYPYSKRQGRSRQTPRPARAISR